ncbi:pyridoxal phosphate-dependent aminotransferase [Actinomycetospora sp. NBC_00405]|uniref:pyridoxal phosphate-dependent aminotransferase n=1 Tax=Actinomycetospora sp. NBC_00405 TaxID=2975952 RepID=UPI003FA48FDA
MDVWAAAGERARTHGDLVNLSAGQPSTPAPADVRAAAARALDEQILGYTSSLGTPELREAIAAHHRRRYGDDTVRAEDVIATTGGSGGFLLAFLAAFDVGDTVVLARPGYPCYRNILAALGCDVVELPCGEGTRFQPTVAMLEALDTTPKGLVVASPANPTGSVIEPDELAALARYCEERGIQLISDEIYHGIEYGDAPPTASAWSTSHEALVVTSFSKYWSMTGWRLGWLLVPERLRRAVDVIAGNFTVCPPVPAQYAALAAFTDASVIEADAHVEHYAINRRLLLDGLPRLGITRLAPADGAFYVYADVAHLTDDTLSFGQRMLAETGVAVAPGIDFDPVDGHTWIRLSFAGATADVHEALDRLGHWLPTL